MINNLINRKSKNRRVISAVKRQNNNGISKNPAEISNIFNQHFASVGQKLASSLPQSSRDFRDYLTTPTYSGSFYFDPVTPAQVETEINLVPNNKASGLYSFPLRIMKCAKRIIS